MFDFSDRVVVVTGAAGNLGSAALRAFYAAGAKVAAVDRRLEKLEENLDDLGGVEAGRLQYVTVNLLDENSVQAMADEVLGHFGRVDVLANIAGGFTMGSPLHETELKTWEFMMNLNARSVFLTCRAFAPGMIAQGQGKIVNISARAALQGAAKMGPYIASKSAVLRLTETLSAELKHSGINVNALLPGTIDTPPNRESMPNADFDKWVSPAALADVVLFLASDAARAVHGVALPVTGLS
jgi:NAD(P)-dependent dehydrogenase (short-subunit alcohol dehydrogenase family)